MERRKFPRLLPVAVFWVLNHSLVFPLVSHFLSVLIFQFLNSIHFFLSFSSPLRNFSFFHNFPISELSLLRFPTFPFAQLSTLFCSIFQFSHLSIISVIDFFVHQLFPFALLLDITRLLPVFSIFQFAHLPDCQSQLFTSQFFLSIFCTV